MKKAAVGQAEAIAPVHQGAHGGQHIRQHRVA